MLKLEPYLIGAILQKLPIARKQQRQLPRCLSSRLSKPTERKRAQSMSISAIPPAKKLKKNKLVSPQSTPAPLSAQPTEPILVQEEEDAEEVEEDEEEEDKEAEENKDEEEDTQLPPPPVCFTSVWKAVAASRREALPGTKSAVYNVNDLFLFQLEAWRDQILVDLLPQKFEISQLQAIASYKKARQADYCPQEIRTRNNLHQALDFIKEWHQHWPSRSLSLNFTLYLVEEKEAETPSQQSSNRQGGRKTATQAQLTTLPDILAAEEASGNRIPAIADR
jgi:hypothetical protein